MINRENVDIIKDIVFEMVMLSDGEAELQHIVGYLFKQGYSKEEIKTALYEMKEWADRD